MRTYNYEEYPIWDCTKYLSERAITHHANNDVWKRRWHDGWDSYAAARFTNLKARKKEFS